MKTASTRSLKNAIIPAIRLHSIGNLLPQAAMLGEGAAGQARLVRLIGQTLVEGEVAIAQLVGTTEVL